MSSKRKVAILGATGAVGQRYIQLLQGHPWFEIEVLAAQSGQQAKNTAKPATGLWNLICQKKLPTCP